MEVAVSERRNWFVLEEREVLEKIGANLQTGLTAEEAQKRKAKYGANLIPKRKRKTPLELFLQQFNQPLVYILLVASVITALLNEWVDSSVIFGVVFINAIVGYLQESKALKAIDVLAFACKLFPTTKLTIEHQDVS